MTTRYHCDQCDWDGDTPTLVEEPGPLGTWTLRVCPECGEEVYQTVVLDPRRGEGGRS
jgi:rRNA maturation protein Nop10